MGEVPGRPVIFGEVLYDRFEDGSAVLGGAPFNVAWHLQGLGLAPLFVSRVGDDEPGAAIHARMAEWGMDTSGLQRDPAHPTGAVQVRLSGAQPTFDILPDQAYDHIDAEAALAALDGIRSPLFYHGTLIARGEVSRRTLAACLTAVGAPAFVDINLRPPWWDRGTVADGLHRARWAKLNGDELAALLDRQAISAEEAPTAMRRLQREFALQAVIVTLGERGALWLGDGAIESGAPPPPPELVDTVGAGDAFSAVAILGLLRGWTAADTLQRALWFASRICAVRGATVADPEFYAAARSRWEHDGR